MHRCGVDSAVYMAAWGGPWGNPSARSNGDTQRNFAVFLRAAPGDANVVSGGNMKRLVPYAAALCALTLSEPALAVDQNGAYWGFSGITCGQFIDDRVHKTDTVDRWWLAGWLSAWNDATPNTFNLLGSDDLSGAMLWIENWCRQNPLKSMSEGARELVNVLYPTRQTKAP